MRAVEGKGTCWRVEEAGKRFCWGEQRLACNGREATCWRMMYNDEGQKAIRSRPLSVSQPQGGYSDLSQT